MPPPAFGGWRHCVFRLSIRLSIKIFLTWQLQNARREFIEIEWKHQLWYDNELIRFWVSRVKVTAEPNVGKNSVLKPKMYQAPTFVNEKYINAVLSISENFKSEGHGHHMTKCGQKYRFGATSLFMVCNHDISRMCEGILIKFCLYVSCWVEMNWLDFEKGAFLCKPEFAMAVEAFHWRYGIDPSPVISSFHGYYSLKKSNVKNVIKVT